MKLTIVEQDTQPPIQDGWVTGLARAKAKVGPGFGWLRSIARLLVPTNRQKTIDWKCIVRIEGLAEADGTARVRFTRTDRTFFQFVPRQRYNHDQPLQAGDNEFSIPIPPNALSALKIDAWQDKAQGNRQSQTLYLLTNRYKWIAYGSLILASVVPLLLLRAWHYADDAILLGDTPISQLLMGLLSAVGISLTAMTGSTVWDLVVRATGKVASSVKDPRQPFLLQRPLLLSIVTILLGVVALPLGFKRVCNATEGKPEIQGHGTPLQQKQKNKASCALLWSPFSQPALSVDSSAFKLTLEQCDKNLEECNPSLGKPANWFGFRTFRIDCQQVDWHALPLQREQGCTLKYEQIFQDPFKFDNKNVVELVNKPFDGVAKWKYDDATLNCSLPAKSSLQVLKVGELRFPATDQVASSTQATDLLGEVLVQCRQEKIEYSLVSQSMLGGQPATGYRDLPVCVPDNAIDCRLTVNAGKDAVAALPPSLLTNRKVSIDGATCTIGYNPDHGPARVAEIKVDKVNGFFIEAGVCITRWIDRSVNEVFAILPDTIDIGWNVPNAPISATFAFPRGLLDGRSLVIKGNGTPNGTVTCAPGANTLVLLDARNIPKATTIYLHQKAIHVHEKNRPIQVGQSDGTKAWLCVDGSRSGYDTKAKKCLKDGPKFNADEKGAQTDPKDDFWLQLSSDPKSMERCSRPVPHCCHVCKQTRGDVSQSSQHVIAPCGATSPSGRSADSCEGYPIKESFVCN